MLLCLIFPQLLVPFVDIINVGYWQVLFTTKEQLEKSQSATSTFKCRGSTAAVRVDIWFICYEFSDFHLIYRLPNLVKKFQGNLHLVKFLKRKKRENYCLINNVINRYIYIYIYIHVQIRILRFLPKNSVFELKSFGDPILERLSYVIVP